MKTLVFTLVVLGSIVAGIYAVFPARDHVLIEEAFARQRDPRTNVTTGFTMAQVAAIVRGQVGDELPMPDDHWQVDGMFVTTVLDNPTAVLRIERDGDVVTYAVQRTRGIAPDDVERSDGTLRAVGWRQGKFTCAVVGAATSRAHWIALRR